MGAFTKSGQKVIGGAKDLLLGKKDPGTKDRYMPLDPSQKKAMGQYKEMLDQTGRMADFEGAQMENQIRSNAMDVGRKATDMVAQRGLGNSSVGLSAILNSTRDMGDRIATTRAALPGMRLDKLNNVSGGINSILNSRTFIQGREAGRKGGLAPLIGAGVGGYMGGASGAQAGYGAGQALTQMG